MKLSVDSYKGEEARIRAVYAKRQRDARYSCLNPGHLFMVQEQEHQLLAILKQHGFERLDTKKILKMVTEQAIGFGSSSNGEADQRIFLV